MRMHFKEGNEVCFLLLLAFLSCSVSEKNVYKVWCFFFAPFSFLPFKMIDKIVCVYCVKHDV